MQRLVEFEGDLGWEERGAVSAADFLRLRILEKIAPILAESDHLMDSRRRLLIQACCLDIMIALEETIQSFRLDEKRPLA